MTPEELDRPFQIDKKRRRPAPDIFRPLPEQPDWKGHERDVADRAGGELVRGSGNQTRKSKGKPRPGDVTGGKGNFHRQAKSAKGASVTVSETALRGVVDEATAMGRVPLVEVRIEQARFPVPTDWVLLPAVDFQEIVESMRCGPGSPRRPS